SRLLAAVLILGASLAPQNPPDLRPDTPIDCASCAAWNQEREPYRVFGNTYYVGVAGLSSILIASDTGLILLDGGLPQSAPLIARNIHTLGFRLQDVRLIVNSHAHYDHAGGIAALQRASGAMVAASAPGARALQQGGPTAEDPQYAFGPKVNRFPPVTTIRTIADGEVIRVGALSLTAHLTPGHTPGSTTWSWRSCEASNCKQIVYADSLNPVSAPGFRFSGDAQNPARLDEFRRSIEKVAALPCDVLLAVHPQFGEGRSCAVYAADGLRRLEERLLTER
ncbi:MAG: subclass B3 metallo-beta-lactamase, partial [Acidobacteriota bacterium]|nr:subclass B3 metallo-beta-lactamase [Acidobacteriota bacterium]